MARSTARIGGAVAALLTAALLAGCAGPTPYSDFERTRDDRDVLPDLGTVDDSIDLDSVRYAGSADGAAVYIALSADDDARCMIVLTEYEPFSGCGGGELETSMPGAFVARLHPDGAGPEDSPGLDWTALGENVSVRAG
ncbi:hypothetical protein GRS96_06540 [Rathayibacter sp. VKM Ac-2803]|uniref:hypothetical protein n=1 Tax=unclassified Rathayibacter TaxID=2609250 RepID=UPI001358AF7F|nr:MULTISPECIES: hypothetical protein [unclassified Rathayibacter]MWV48935.1 hypothetical protein [Rathayibacter sp. VKM Ac-2803]MWV58572.1 hypothetical protein [Rathayibacter sp. VKM Ac-2754]